MIDDSSQISFYVLASSEIIFGTSGARGLVEQFTDEVSAAFTAAFLTTARATFVVKRVAVAIDRRPSSPAIAAACIGMAQAMGYEVDYYGILPTPALALQSMSEGIPAIMITGSHIPFDRNGIKFYRPDGEITKADEQAILQVQAPMLPFVAALPAISSLARFNYIAHYKQRFKADFLAGWRIGVYEHSAAGRDISCEVLREFGAEVISLGRSDEFVPIDTEAVSTEDVQRGLNWSKEYNLDAIFSTDGDGDRPLVADENGQWLRGDLLGLICARSLNVDALAVPVSCNTAIEACGAFKEVLRTRIGSPYVIEGMQQLSARHQTVAGFEANGGFLMDDLPTRDALLPALALFQAACEYGKSISALTQQLPQRYTVSGRLQNISIAKSQMLLAAWQAGPLRLQRDLHFNSDIQHLDTTDGLRMTLEGGDIIHLRPSGNAPELRCYVESNSSVEAQRLLDVTLGLLPAFFNTCQQL